MAQKMYNIHKMCIMFALFINFSEAKIAEHNQRV